MRYLNVDAAVTVLVNIMPLTDAGDFVTRETGVAYNASGLALYWIFETTAGVITRTQVTPTDTGGNYDWTHLGGANYKIEIPASGGASVNNDAEGYGHFEGVADGVLSWVGPTYCFRKALINDSLINGTEFLPIDGFRQKFTISSTTLQPKKPDGTTDTDYSKTLGTDAAAIPIISST